MFKKFESFMYKYVMPIASKAEKQRHLSAIKVAMVAMKPFIILGSLFALIPVIPNMLGENNLLSKIITQNEMLLNLPVTLSIGIISIYVVICISYHLGEYYKLYIPGCITLSLFSFLIISIDYVEGVVSFANFSSRGMFCAMIVGILSVEVYRLCKEKKFTIILPKDVPEFVSGAFELIPITVMIALLSVLARGLSIHYFDVLPPEIFIKIFEPLLGSMDNIWFVFGLHFIILLVYFFGVHYSVFSSITGPIRTTFIVENIEAMQKGIELPHFYTGGSSSAFFSFTGTGLTIGLVIACIMSKSQKYKKIGKASLVSSLFGVNEPIVFGAPIILNPIMFIPFVFGGLFIGMFPLFLIDLGIMKKPFFDPPYVGIFLEGFLTNGDYVSIIANAIQIVLSILVYYPFFKIMESQELAKENKNI